LWLKLAELRKNYRVLPKVASDGRFRDKTGGFGGSYSVNLRASSASSEVGSHLWVSDRIYSSRKYWIQLRSWGEKERRKRTSRRIPVSGSREKQWNYHSQGGVVDFEPELKEQDPKKSKRLQRRGLAG
jgi:hypothetical protein